MSSTSQRNCLNNFALNIGAGTQLRVAQINFDVFKRLLKKVSKPEIFSNIYKIIASHT